MHGTLPSGGELHNRTIECVNPTQLRQVLNLGKTPIFGKSKLFGEWDLVPPIWTLKHAHPLSMVLGIYVID
jgi:hypothetical protein